jgi:Arc/MetJ-type ribon-helix-helix transcriptional regulator
MAILIWVKVRQHGSRSEAVRRAILKWVKRQES